MKWLILQDKVAVAMIEEHIRFMILAQYELSEVGEGIADKEAFNAHLNIEQVNKVSPSMNPRPRP